MIFLVFQESNGSYTNPLPGTIVDNHITRFEIYDFFLVAQAVRQGTVSPTHFIVLQDDSNYGPDIIHKLSYKLCFLYFNWPGTVRIPACCMVSLLFGYLCISIHFGRRLDTLTTKSFMIW